jgi:hypothetical protein
MKPWTNADDARIRAAVKRAEKDPNQTTLENFVEEMAPDWLKPAGPRSALEPEARHPNHTSKENPTQ